MTHSKVAAVFQGSVILICRHLHIMYIHTLKGTKMYNMGTLKVNPTVCTTVEIYKCLLI